MARSVCALSLPRWRERERERDGAIQNNGVKTLKRET